MSQSLPLIREGSITLSAALDVERNILQELTYPKERVQFLWPLWKSRRDLESLVALHLGVPSSSCSLGDDLSKVGQQWIHGSFNYCIPFDVTTSQANKTKRVFLRFPLPYKIGETVCPGNAEEKLRCETATYIWLQENCPGVPIARLRGFGFGGSSFVSPADSTLNERIHTWCRRTLMWILGRPVPCHYSTRRLPRLTDMPYMILDEVENGQMLSTTWYEQCNDQSRRLNFFTGLSRIMLSVSRHTFPRIGSLTIDHDGVISLSNRPLECGLHQLENDGVPSQMPRDLTYHTADTYYSDLLNCHDQRIRHVANSVNDVQDGQLQLGVLALMRAVSHHFVSRELRSGPFVLMLTDAHQSNVFVDDDWNITSLIDLEWACVRPLEMLHPPHWLSNKCVDELMGEELVAYDNLRQEFMTVFEQEELAQNHTFDVSRTQTMSNGWRIGNFWYFHALDSFVGMCNLFSYHIQPRFATDGFVVKESSSRSVSNYWTQDSTPFIAAKVVERQTYQNQLRKFFEKTLKERALERAAKQEVDKREESDSIGRLDSVEEKDSFEQQSCVEGKDGVEEQDKVEEKNSAESVVE